MVFLQHLKRTFLCVCVCPFDYPNLFFFLTPTHSGSESPFSSMSEDVTVGDDVSSMMAPSEIFLEQSEWLGPASVVDDEEEEQ